MLDGDKAPRSNGRSLPPASIIGPILGFTVLVLALMSTGCTDQERIEKLKTQTQEAQDSLQQVIDEQQALRKESQKRTESLQRANDLITNVAEQLAELTRQEDALREVIEKVESKSADVETVALTPEADSMEKAIRDGLADVESQLEDTRAALGRLEEERAEMTTMVKNFEDWMSQLEKRLEEREATVDRLRADANDLKQKLNRIEETNTTLRTENTDLRSANEDLRQAYVVTADGDSLARMGILDRPFLGFLGKAKLKTLDRSKFRRIETRTTRIALPADRKGVKVQSPHRYEPELYGVEGDELVIRDPEEFWTVSRFLVVQVER